MVDGTVSRFTWIRQFEMGENSVGASRLLDRLEFLQDLGMTRPYLNKFLAVQPDNPWGPINRAMLLLGYELLTRRSELVALTTNDLERQADGTMRDIIRRSKADPFGQGRVAFTS